MSDEPATRAKPAHQDEPAPEAAPNEAGHPITAAGATDFIRANTRLQPVPHAPEIVLHLADEALPLWHRTEEELGRMGLPPPYWAFAWAGGQALARFVLDNPALVAGRRVLDLASGSGLVAIAAAKAGAAPVVASEIDVFAEAAIALNAAANGVHVDVLARDVLDDSPAAAPRYDAVMVGDFFYERETAARALAFLERQAAAGVQVLIGDPGRTYLPKDRLVQLAEYRVPVTRELEDEEIKRTAVWTLA
ncbi:MAG: methyltransferase [Variibacter sp.]|nr:methyltransferase [Variibacter sp.]